MEREFGEGVWRGSLFRLNCEHTRVLTWQCFGLVGRFSNFSGVFFSEGIFSGFLGAKENLKSHKKWLERNSYLWPVVTEPTDETIIHESWGGDSTGHQPAIFFFCCILTFSCDTCCHPPLHLLVVFLATLNVFTKPKACSLQIGWTHPLAWWKTTQWTECGLDITISIPSPAFNVWVLQVNRGSLQIGKNSSSIFLGEWQEVIHLENNRPPSFTKEMPPRTDTI